MSEKEISKQNNVDKFEIREQNKNKTEAKWKYKVRSFQPEVVLSRCERADTFHTDAPRWFNSQTYAIYLDRVNVRKRLGICTIFFTLVHEKASECLHSYSSWWSWFWRSHAHRLHRFILLRRPPKKHIQKLSSQETIITKFEHSRVKASLHKCSKLRLPKRNIPIKN